MIVNIDNTHQVSYYQIIRIFSIVDSKYRLYPPGAQTADKKKETLQKALAMKPLSEKKSISTEEITSVLDRLKSEFNISSLPSSTVLTTESSVLPIPSMQHSTYVMSKKELKKQALITSLLSSEEDASVSSSFSVLNTPLVQIPKNAKSDGSGAAALFAAAQGMLSMI